VLALSGTAAKHRIIVGNGARYDTAKIVSLAETLGAPVANTFKAKGPTIRVRPSSGSSATHFWSDTRPVRLFGIIVPLGLSVSQSLTNQAAT
jgi:thiamine pyrophosphate-dependent acetolactate synthase large subunit-like protein